MTIQEAFSEFLAEQQRRLALKMFAKYSKIGELLQHCLNSYAYQRLTADERKRLDAAQREFCEIFARSTSCQTPASSSVIS